MSGGGKAEIIFLNSEAFVFGQNAILSRFIKHQSRRQEMELSGPSSEIPTVYQIILGLGILSKVHFQPKILRFRGYIVKQEMELLKQEMELSGHSSDDFRLWNFVKSPFLAKVIVFQGLHIQTGNGIIETGNRIIWTFQQDSH